MKCPQCSSDLNVRDTLTLPRFENADLTLCAFCETVVALDTASRMGCVLDACASCGAPIEQGPGSGRTLCGSCGDAQEKLLEDPDSIEEAADKILKEVLGVFPAVASGEADEYVGDVLAGLAARAGYERKAFRILITADLGLHAASIPGGVILVGRDLLRALEDEAMLAFVLGREIAHQHSGRVARRFRAWRAPGPLATSLQWSLGWITKGSLSVGRSAADLVREVAWLGYGSVHEQHADEWALKLLALDGYDPRSGVRHLARMEKRHLEERGVLAAFLDAHPARSRRRCLAETLVEIEASRNQLFRVNRDRYQRMAATLGRDDLVLVDPMFGTRLDPRA